MHLEAHEPRRLTPEVVRARRARDALIEWRRRQRDDGGLPRRRDFDPLAVPHLLGHLMIVDVLREPLRFRVRLYGTEIAALTEQEWTGCLVDGHHLGILGAHVAAELETTLTVCAPTAGANTIRRPRTPPIDYEVMRMPLSRGDGTIDKILACVEPV